MLYQDEYRKELDTIFHGHIVLHIHVQHYNLLNIPSLHNNKYAPGVAAGSGNAARMAAVGCVDRMGICRPDAVYAKFRFIRSTPAAGCFYFQLGGVSAPDSPAAGVVFTPH